MLKVHPPAELAEGDGVPGEVLAADPSGVVVACGQGALRLKRLQLQGQRALDVDAFLSGHAIAVGTVLGQ